MAEVAVVNLERRVLRRSSTAAVSSAVSGLGVLLGGLSRLVEVVGGSRVVDMVMVVYEASGRVVLMLAGGVGRL